MTIMPGWRLGVDGKWHYIGACEPDAELDVAWFSAPVKRAMMVHTNVFGLYNGPEEKNVQTELYSVINLLPNYTETRSLKVKITDEKGNPVEGASVKFNVYNYAEFYPIATATTSKEGSVSVVTGMGDVFVWASKDGLSGYGKSEVKENELVVKLTDMRGTQLDESIVMNVPAEQSVKELPAEKIAENAKRLAYEDSIRNAYMNTFVSEADARRFAADNNLNPDKIWNILSKSQGNWQEIKAFIGKNKDNGYLFPFLESLKDKDLRDTPAGYLSDHLIATGSWPNGIPDFHKRYAQYILSPRIALELIRPWRSFFKKELSADFINKSRSDIQYVIDFVRDSIKIDNDQNYFKCPLSPQGVYELRIADSHSRNIFFVALCRSMDILTRIDPATIRPQYLKAETGLWTDVYFDEKSEEKPKAYIAFTNAKGNIVKPGYYTHFTIARFDNGNFVTLDYEDEIKGLPAKVTVDAGYYRLMTGSRANDGSVSIDTRYFEIKENENKSLEIKLPEVDRGGIQVQGIVDPNTIVTLEDGAKKTLKELTNKKGLVICFADPNKEPSKHILQDLPAVKEALDDWGGGGILYIIPDDKVSTAFNRTAFANLPSQLLWLTDDKRTLLNTVARALQIEFSENFPLTIYLSTNGGILYSSQGYRIGIGEDILKTIEKEKSTK